MLRRGIAALLGIAAAACAREPLPPGFEGIEIGMPVEKLKEVRPNLVEDKPGRLFDASGPAAYRVVDGRLAGLRVLVRPPASKEMLARYADKFAAEAIGGAPYNFQIDGHLLKLFSVREGVEILFGVDPGAAHQEENAGRAGAVPLGPQLKLGRTSRMPEAPVLPVGEDVSGVDVWLLRLSATSTGPVSLRFVLGAGSAGETPAALGATAVVAEWVLDRAAAEADSKNVRADALTLRAAVLFTLHGNASEVASIASKIAGELASLGGSSISQSSFDRAYGSSLRQSVGTRFERRLLEDEGLAALFPGSGFGNPPVDLSRPAPELAEVNARATELAAAPLAILAAGSARREDVREIAREAGARAPDARTALAKPALPNRETRAVAGPALAIDGVWVEAKSFDDAAMLLLARSLLADRAQRTLRPIAVIGGGIHAGSYLAMITAGTSSAAEALDLASRSALSTLPESMPFGQTFDDVRQSARALLVRQLGTPEDAIELMTDLVLLRARPEWTRAILERIPRIGEAAAKAFLLEVVRDDRTFSVRWGPEG